MSPIQLGLFFLLQQRLTQIEGLLIIQTQLKGRGVACIQTIEKHSIIEVCPAIICDSESTALLHRSHLHDYYFIWDAEEKTSAIALGYGSLYNHSNEPNADFEVDYDSQSIIITALSQIESMQEITLDYNSGKSSEHSLWFKIH